MGMSAQDVRYLAVSLLTLPTARDGQKRVGASNLSNGCQYCLACNLIGDTRESPLLEKLFLGHTTGTALHGLIAERGIAAMEQIAATSGYDHVRSVQMEAIASHFDDARIEEHIPLGTLGTYGEVGSTPDLVLGSDLIDWKSSTRHKSAIMRDALGQTAFGRTHKDVKLSEAKYAEEIAAALFKITGYVGQESLYAWACNKLGIPVDTMSLVFINRDGTGFYDLPSAAGYDDESKMRDVWVLNLPYDEGYAEAVWNRGLQIWEALENGATPSDFPRHEHCFPCSNEPKDLAVAA